MRSLLACLLVLAIPAAASAGSTPPALRGAWKSDRERTLAAMRRTPGLTAEQRARLSAPDFFGHLVQVHRGGEAIVAFDGTCSVMPYEVVATGDAHVDVRFRDAGGELVTRRVHLVDDGVWVQAGPVREFFRRIDLAAAKARHPCLREALAEAR